MSNPLQQRIDERRNELAALEARRVIITAEIRAYEDALALIGDQSPQSQPTMQRSFRRQSGQWPAILEALAKKHPVKFDLDAVERIAAEVGAEPTRGGIRSKMAALTDQGTLERVGFGEFRFTEKGRGEYGVQSPSRQTETPSSGDEGVLNFEQSE